MQDTIRLIIYTILTVIGVWFITMTINTHMFLHSDIDPLVNGFIPLNKTDVGGQCGPEYENSARVIDYKLNTENQIVYLCPQGISPIRTTVVAARISDFFRNKLRPDQLAKVNAAYPPTSQPVQQPLNPGAAPAPAANAEMSNTVPTAVMPPANPQPSTSGDMTTPANNSMTPQATTSQPAPVANDNTNTAPAYVPPAPSTANGAANTVNPAATTAPSDNSMMTPPPITNPQAPAGNNNANSASAPANTMAPAPQNP